MGRRHALLVVTGVLAGCGRIGFESGVGDGGGGLDGPRVPAGCVGPDEDGDGWPDACDNCLTDVNPAQEDRGELEVGEAADGVGDACDPRPAQPGDFVQLFAAHDTPFADYNHIDAWSYPGNGTLRLGGGLLTGSAFFVTTAPVTRIDTQYAIAGTAVSDQQWFGTWIDVGSGRDAIFANIRNTPNDTVLPSAVIKEQSEPDVDRYSPDVFTTTDNLLPGQTFRIVMDTNRVTGGDFVLTLTDLGTGQRQTTSLAVMIPEANEGYVHAYNVLVDVSYLVVYGK